MFAWPSGERYVGQMVNGEMHGRGKKTWPDGKRYQGDF